MKRARTTAIRSGSKAERSTTARMSHGEPERSALGTTADDRQPIPRLSG
jgi:hypothetical protein